MASIGCSASTCARALGALGRLGQQRVEGSRHVGEVARGRADLAQRGEGGGRGRQERRLRRLGEARRGGALGLRRTARRSAGGGDGLPDLPREGRGLGVVSETRAWRVGDARFGRVGAGFSGRGMGEIYGAQAARRQLTAWVGLWAALRRPKRPSSTGTERPEKRFIRMLGSGPDHLGLDPTTITRRHP